MDSDNKMKTKSISENLDESTILDETSPRIEIHIPSMYHKISTIVQNKTVKSK